MKLISIATIILCFGFALSAGNKTLTTDPLTELPIIPSPDPFHLGNEPQNIPDTTVCKSKMETNFYSVNQLKVDATLTWYGSHLPGFKKTHAYASGRSQDAFYNSAGTLMVNITGSPAKDGENSDTYAIVYAKFQPPLSEKAIASLISQNIVCP
jgi:hypothetical protein